MMLSAITQSVMAMSTCRPFPLRAASNSAARMPVAADSAPPATSATGRLPCTGAPPALPVWSSTPASDW
ncbi:hypothetical protein D3C76_1670280 [compost metagenome]